MFADININIMIKIPNFKRIQELFRVLLIVVFYSATFFGCLFIVFKFPEMATSAKIIFLLIGLVCLFVLKEFINYLKRI